MRGPNRRTPWWRRSVAALLAVASVASFALAGCGGDERSGPATSFEGLVRADPLQVGDVSITEVALDGSETPFTMRAPAGELLFVYFGYTTCPDLCPTTLSDLKFALQSLDPVEAERVNVAFVTVDPERDVPEVLVPYLGYFVEGGHALRTEDFDELERVEDAFGASSTITPNDRGGYEVSHTAISYVVDGGGTVRLEWPFGVSHEAMAHDLAILLEQTSSG